MGTALLSPPVKFMIDIRMTSGMHIQRRNLSYEGLKNLIEKWRDYAEYYRNEQVLLHFKRKASQRGFPYGAKLNDYCLYVYIRGNEEEWDYMHDGELLGGDKRKSMWI